MKAVVYMQVNQDNNSLLLDKIIELGYVAMTVWTSEKFLIYQVDVDQEDLTILKLSVPFLQVDIPTL